MKLRDLQGIKQMKILETKKWFVAYYRKSEEDKDRQVASIASQERVCGEIISQRKLPILKVFREEKSAKKPGRPEFNAMVQLIESRNDIKGIVCWKPSRLFRNPVDEGKIRWLISPMTKTIDEIVTPYRTYFDVDSDFILAVEGAGNQKFITDLRENTKVGIDSKLEKGMFPGLAPPGYRNNIEKRQGEKDISPHPVYFTLMRKLFELALTGNFTLQNLVVKAKELGIKNSRGKYISKSQMAKDMRNPFYTGIRFVYAGKLYTNGVHKRMLTDEEFDLLQDILSARSRPRKQKHGFWHTGIPIICGECGCHVTGDHKVKRYKNGKIQIFNYARCTKKNTEHKCSQNT